MKKIFEQYIKPLLAVFVCIVIPAFMILGRLIDISLATVSNDTINTSFCLILPIIALALFCIAVAKFYHKWFGYVAITAVLAFVVIFGLYKFEQRYPFFTYGIHTQERQQELDKTKQVEAPFVEPLRLLYLDDTLSYYKASEKVKFLLGEENGKSRALQFLKDEANRLKSERKQVKEIEEILEEIKNLRNSDENSFKNSTQPQTQEIKSTVAETPLGPLERKCEVTFKASKPFQIILSVDGGSSYIEVNKPAGRSTQKFDYGGFVRIRGDRPDVKITNIRNID